MARPERRWARVVVAFAAALPILFLAFGPRDLWAPDEPRYGRVAHEMATEGDWLVPHLNGLAYAEKPPLVYWLVAATESALGGPSPFRARLPAAVLASLAVLATAALARRWFHDREIAATAALLFATTALVVWNESRLGLDLPMTLGVVLALEGASAAIVEGSWGGMARLGLGLGIGLLAKGPHAFYVPIGGAIGGVLATRRGTNAALLRPPGAGLRFGAGMLLGVAILATWLVPALLHGRDLPTASGVAYSDRLLGQIENRVSGEAEPHEAGPFYFVPTFLWSSLPWTLFLVLGIAQAVRLARAPVADRFGLGAALGALALPFLALSVASSKREIYLIPLFPAAAILSAYALHRAPDARSTRVGVSIAVGAALLAPFAVGAAPWILDRTAKAPDALDVVTLHRLASGQEAYLWIVLSAFVLLPLAGFVFLARRDSVRAVRRAAVGAAAVVLVFLLPAMEAMDGAKSFRAFAEAARREAPDAPLYVAGSTDVSALWAFGWKRATVLSYGPDATKRAADVLAPGAPKALLLAKKRFWDAGAPSRRGDPAAALSLARAKVLWEQRVGGFAWHLLTNAPAP